MISHFLGQLLAFVIVFMMFASIVLGPAILILFACIIAGQLPIEVGNINPMLFWMITAIILNIIVYSDILFSSS